MPARPTAAPRAVALLAAVALTLVAALTLTAGPAVADTGTLARTGVAAFNLADGDGVAPTTDISPGQRQETSFDSYDLASGSRVATRAGGGGGDRTFYTVQSAADEARLASGGKPWPNAPERAQFGEGVYSWGSRADADAYAQHLMSRGACDLRVCSFQVGTDDLSAMRQVDVDSLADPSAFMQKHSTLWGGTPDHGYDYITRGTNFGTEHFFSSSVFDKLRFGGSP